MSDCTVYIDEAGDLGFGRGTKWFVLTAVIVNKADERNIRNKMEQIKTRLNVREIHLRKITDFYKRAYIVKELAAENFVYMNVILDTDKFDVAKIPTPHIAYNYVCKYLLQRVTWYLHEQGKTADLVLSARGTSRDGELIDYIRQKLLPYDYNDIYSETIGSVTAKGAGSWELLQLADVCATTMFTTYEPNSMGFRTPCFSYALQDHLYRKNGNLMKYGIKFFVNDMIPTSDELRANLICTKKERTPGATTT